MGGGQLDHESEGDGGRSTSIEAGGGRWKQDKGG